MPTQQRVEFPHVSQQGGRGGFTQQLLKGLRLAALFTEPPQHRLQRLQEERRERESRFGMAQDEERTAIARQREQRQSQEGSRRSERDDLATKLDLASRGKHLSPEELEGMQSGTLLGLDMGHGVNVGPGGGTVAQVGEDSFFVPGRQAQQDIDLQGELDRQAAIDKLKKVPLPGKLAEALGMEEGTPVESSALDDLLRAANASKPKEPEQQVTLPPELAGLLGISGPVPLSQVDDLARAAGSLRDKPKTASPSEVRAQAKAERDKFVNGQVSQIARSAQSFSEAQSLLRKAAESDEKVAGEFAAIERALAEHFGKTQPKQSSSSGLNPSLSAALQGLGGGPRMAGETVAAEETTPDEEFEAYFNKRFGGR